MGARRNFPDGAKPPTPKKSTFFGVPKAQTIFFFAFSQHFRLILRVGIASEKFRIFAFRRKAVHNIFFQIPGGASVPPPSAGARGLNERKYTLM